MVIYAILFINITWLAANNVPYPNKIDYRNEMDKDKTNQKEVSDQCFHELLSGYGFQADVKNLGEANPLCPNIKSNCCGPKDQKKSLEHFKYTDSHYYENHQKVILYIIKYILGFSKQYRQIANDYMIFYRSDDNKEANVDQNKSDSKNFKEYKFTKSEHCYRNARKVLKNGYNDRTHIQAMYYNINRKINFLQNTRRAFYCTVCDAESRYAFGNYRWFLRWVKFETIHIDSSFCGDLINNLAEIIYQIHYDLQKYVRNVMKMMVCVGDSVEDSSYNNQNNNKNNNRNKITDEDFIKFPFGSNLDATLSICLNYPLSNSKLKFFCAFFCSMWRYTNFTAMFDQDIQSAYKTFEFLRERKDALPNSLENGFNDDMAKLETTIIAAYTETVNAKQFYFSNSTSGNYHDFDTVVNFIFYGVHPIEQGENSQYKFSWKSVSRLSMLFACFFVLIFTFFN